MRALIYGLTAGACLSAMFAAMFIRGCRLTDLLLEHDTIHYI